MDNTFLSKESVEMQLKAITDENLRRQEIYGEILDDVIENCIVNLVDFAIEKRAGIDNHFICGCDFARNGVDSTCLVVRNNIEIIEIVKLDKADTEKIVSVYRSLDNQYRFKNTYLDATGGYDIRIL